MIRLVHVTTLPQSAATFLQGQLRWLRDRGLQITVISSPGTQLAEFAQQEGVDWASVPLTRVVSPAADLRAIARMSSAFRRIRPQIVHAHTPKAGLVAMVAAQLVGVPVRIYHLHGLRFETSHGWRRQLLLNAERATCSLAHRVLCVSNSVRTAAIQTGLVSSTRAKVLAHGSINGIDIDQFRRSEDYLELRQAVRRRFGIPEDALCLGFVGRLVRDKGIVELHDAWQELRVRFPHLHLLLVGPFEQEDAVPATIRTSLTADPRVHLAGLDWNVRPYYCAMDVFTLPTHREGLGTVLLEAAAMELPIVSSRCTGCVDAVGPHHARLVEVGDSRALATAIADYLGGSDQRRTAGVLGRKFVTARFQPQRVWQAVWDEYHLLLSGTQRVSSSPPVPLTAGSVVRKHVPGESQRRAA